jgi:hypothetical protein
MGVDILQQKGNKLNGPAIGKKLWAYRIGTPQRFISLINASTHTALLATAKSLVEFFFKWAWVFFDTRAINKIAQLWERSLGLIVSVQRNDLLVSVALVAHTAEIATSKPFVEFLFKLV